MGMNLRAREIEVNYQSLVQSRKRLVRWFLAMSGDEGNLLEGIDSAIWRAVFLADSDWEGQFIVVDQRNFHSVFTGNAERGVPVVGPWFSVGFMQA
jgi:hypothetical protein